MPKFDFSELTDFREDLLSFAKDLHNGKHAKKFLGKSGTKLKNATVKDAKSKVNKVTGNLFEGIKRGKPYKYFVDRSMAVRVYGGKKASHLHLLNDGHRIVDKNDKEHGFVEGKHFMESALNGYEEQYVKDTLDFLDDLLDNHLL